ncbi:hypothetical protein BDZ88DRAFT_408611 [Geranomyces variabilis]|nr:hypothetical protein BDZ88DRAFT_408611 [Geranomyces variabilis]KAJ3142165.1 hypothetical protein HDU90_004438 [Geranomyces variabilis]
MISTSSSPAAGSPGTEAAPNVPSPAHKQHNHNHTHQHHQQQQQQQLDDPSQAHHSLSQPPPGLLNTGYHDEICSHLYNNGFIRGLYADLIVHLQTAGTGSPGLDGSSGVVIFKLHKIIAIRSPYFAHLLAEMEDNAANGGPDMQGIINLTIPAHDPNLTPEGFSIALASLYASYSQSLLVDQSTAGTPQRSALLRSVLCAATLLHLAPLAALATAQIKADVSRDTVLDYCLYVSDPAFAHAYGQHTSMELREAVLVYLTKGVVHDVCHQHGVANVWADREAEPYKDLVATFSKLPFEWLKKVVESRGFKVPSDLDRYQFAKEVVAIRQRARTAAAPNAQPQTTASMLLAGEENVLLAFGTTDRTGVTIVRKAVRHHHHHHHNHNNHLQHHPGQHAHHHQHSQQQHQSSHHANVLSNGQYHNGPYPNGSSPPSPPNPAASSASQGLHGMPPPVSASQQHVNGRGMVGVYPGERRVWKAGH